MSNDTKWVIGAVVVLTGAVAGCDIGASRRAIEASRQNAPVARRVWEESRQRKWEEVAPAQVAVEACASAAMERFDAFVHGHDPLVERGRTAGEVVVLAASIPENPFTGREQELVWWICRAKPTPDGDYSVVSWSFYTPSATGDLGSRG